MIIHDKQAIFYHIPKNAGSTVKYMLGQYGIDLEFIKMPYINDNNRLINTVADYTDKYISGHEECKDYFKFTFLRDPIDRLISGWKYKGQDKEFDDFVYNLDNEKDNGMIWHSRISQFTQLNSKIEDMDFIGHVNYFEDHFNKLLEIMDLPKKEIVKRNKSQLKRKLHIDDNLRKYIEKKYKTDYNIMDFVNADKF